MTKVQSTIQFHAADRPIPVKNRRRIKAFIKAQFLSLNRPFDKLDYIFCSDNFLLDINIRFLKHDFLTDIITFPLHNDGEPIAGEIYISVERVRENAVCLKVSEQQEHLRVIFHGALHLLGFKDKTSKEAEKMRKAEDLWLKGFEAFHVEH